MIKVLMVDDERLIIQGFLHSVDWESYGYEIIGTAESSKSALKICEKIYRYSYSRYKHVRNEWS